MSRTDRTDVVVLGAGIIGISLALHLQEQGRSVVLVDRRGMGEEASAGNAGMIVRAAVLPYAFPRDPRILIASLLKQFGGFNYHFLHLLRKSPWLAAYWWHSRGARYEQTVQDMLPLIEASVSEHDYLASAAAVQTMLHPCGWLAVYRSQRTFLRAVHQAAELEKYGLNYKVESASGLQANYPVLKAGLAGGIHWQDPKACPDPKALVKSYGKLFLERGGKFIVADARQLTSGAAGWLLPTQQTTLLADHAVIALGAWSRDVYQKLGYDFPMEDKRGYHMHYGQPLDQMLSLPVTDVDNGFVLAPMTQGIRLTTGVELAARDAQPTPVQLPRLERYAREIIALGEPADTKPWMGTRPCFADMRPVMGPASKHKNLWFSFGHNHLGFALGPVSGRMLAQMMTGQKPTLDATAFRADRF